MSTLLNYGQENAILLRELAEMTECSKRSVQAKIQRMRDEGKYNILSSSRGGYFLASNDDKGEREAMEYERMMIRQAIGRLQRAKKSMEWRQRRKQMRFYAGEKLEEIESLLLTYLSEDLLKKEEE